MHCGETVKTDSWLSGRSARLRTQLIRWCAAGRRSSKRTKQVAAQEAQAAPPQHPEQHECPRLIYRLAAKLLLPPIPEPTLMCVRPKPKLAPFRGCICRKSTPLRCTRRASAVRTLTPAGYSHRSQITFVLFCGRGV